MVSKSSLYIVATPIGNLEDTSLRALEVLKNVDFIISEDARVTSKLLKHFNIEKSQMSYRDENKHKAIPKILNLLESGACLALVSDSGTPLISDPGFKLVQKAVQSDFNVEAIPGASSVITALAVSGLPTDKFAFVGFLPRKDSARKKTLKQYGFLDSTLIIFESPYRVSKLLSEIFEVLGDRYVCVAKELTKLHEKKFYGKVSRLAESLPKRPKGEHVVMVAKEGFNG